MLDWLGHRHDLPALVEAATTLEAAVEDGFRERTIRPIEHGGDQGTKAYALALRDRLDT